MDRFRTDGGGILIDGLSTSAASTEMYSRGSASKELHPRAHLQLDLMAQATVSSSSVGSIHAHCSTSTHHAHCSILTCLPSVPSMCPLEQMTLTNYRATCSQGYMPIRTCSHYSPVLPRLRAH
ncbi:hypothetical protein F2Q69_00005214 [Brassica cretica]|uniref:Uncharacterized protein n=1 Tax=Brassica cretica TaxID=69181 RepID=A0A8S9P4X6_BRACR|nr:hypothetical protein F2Q69_00005214 [Brassica cretica]